MTTVNSSFVKKTLFNLAMSSKLHDIRRYV